VDTLGIALETSDDFPMIFPMKFQVFPQVLDPTDREVMNLIKVMNHIKATRDRDGDVGQTYLRS
jgi:hypothetical protein